jgi:hypothetical protein
MLRALLLVAFPAAAPTARSLLAKLVRERQGVYAAFLGRLMSGWSVSSAAVACSIRRESVRDWLSQGLSDQQADIDTFYSRFASDVHAAVAYCVGDCEAQLASRNPLAYLQTGPGRAFYAREQYWQPQQPGGPLPDDDLNPLSVISTDSAQQITDRRMAEALQILRAQGVLHDPQFAQQLGEQHGINLNASPDAPAVDAP